MHTTTERARAGSTPAEKHDCLDPLTLARLLSMTDGIGVRGGRAKADAALLAMIESHPPASRAFRALRCLADDAGVGTDEADWPLAACTVHAQLDQLLAMAEPSDWADPGFLLDPCGDDGTQLGRLLHIARAYHRHGDKRADERHVTWLASAATNEEGPRGWQRQRERRLADWPFNATGTMDSGGDESLPMIVGALSAIELRFRAEMAHAAHALRTQPDDLRATHARLRRLVLDLGNRSLRMGGLAVAGLAQIYAIHADLRGSAIPPLMGLPPADAALHLSKRATDLIVRSGHGTEHDACGREAFLLRLDSLALMAKPDGRQGRRPLQRRDLGPRRSEAEPR